MTDGLTLFGKRLEQGGACWPDMSLRVGGHRVVIEPVFYSPFGDGSDAYRWSVGNLGSARFATPAEARDDAEATLRKLRDALTEVIGDG
jgi:hypothetical protein